MKTRRQFFYTLLIFGIFLFVNISCVTIRKIEYFRDFENFADPTANPRTHNTIQAFDQLSIIVLSADQQTAQILNYAGENQEVGYQVDQSGNVFFPFAGNINIAGLTTAQAAEKIRDTISRVVSNPMVIVSFMKTQITVMGEVNSQGVYPVSGEKLNIYEALALGGGITEWGDRRKVVLMRVIDNKPRFFPLNLTDSKIAYSEFFYVRPNDVIIVEPLRAKIYRNSFYRDIMLTLTGLITTIVVYTQGNIFSR